MSSLYFANYVKIDFTILLRVEPRLVPDNMTEVIARIFAFKCNRQWRFASVGEVNSGPPHPSSIRLSHCVVVSLLVIYTLYNTTWLDASVVNIRVTT